MGPFEKRASMTIFDDLRESHAVQRSLARTMTNARASTAHRRAAFLALANELDAHATAEERHFYVPLLMDDAGLSVSRHALADHHKAEELVEQLRGVDPPPIGSPSSPDNCPRRFATTWTKRSTGPSNSQASCSRRRDRSNSPGPIAPSTPSVVAPSRSDVTQSIA